MDQENRSIQPQLSSSKWPQQEAVDGLIQFPEPCWYSGSVGLDHRPEENEGNNDNNNMPVLSDRERLIQVSFCTCVGI